MKKLLLLLLMAGSAHGAFTSFYCNSGATGAANTNSGSTDGASVYVSVNGNWDGTSVFTPVDGSTPASTVSAQMWGSVYLDGANPTVWIGRITNVAAGVNGAITFDRAAKSGTAPASGATGRTLVVGGAWSGPGAAVTFPFNFVEGSMTNSSGDSPRVNIKGTYFCTALTESGNNGPVWFQGYTNAAGDGGMANIYGTNNVAGYVLLTVSGKNRSFAYLQFATNGNSGATTQHGISVTSSENLFAYCVAHDFRVGGFDVTAASTVAFCEAWNCNIGNGSAFGAFRSGSAGAFLLYNNAHHNNAGANGNGFETDGAQAAIGNISWFNSGNGFNGTGDVQLDLINNVAYSNAGWGIALTGSSGVIGDAECIIFINNALVLNAKGGITNTTGINGYYNGFLINNGFGAGTKVNGTYDVSANFRGLQALGSFSFTANNTPWNAPDTGDFTITSNGQGARAAGYQKYFYMYTNAIPTFTSIGFPDVGSAQSITNSGGSGGTVGYGFAQ